jgi:hypothetical protein
MCYHGIEQDGCKGFEDEKAFVCGEEVIVVFGTCDLSAGLGELEYRANRKEADA